MTEYRLATNQPYSLRVLVVQDSAILSMELEQLISAAGMEVVGRIADAAKILPIAGAIRPDVVVMDVQLGDEESDIDVAIRLHLDFDIPSIFISGYDNRHIMARAQAARPIAYLSKPVASKELVAFLNELQWICRIRGRSSSVSPEGSAA